MITFISLIVSVFAAGMCVGVAVERFNWWRRGHRDENPEIR